LRLLLLLLLLLFLLLLLSAAQRVRARRGADWFRVPAGEGLQKLFAHDVC
jgi:hypothetical protein